MITDGASPSSAPPTQAVPRSLLAPGFRFHPTDVELVLYYLKRKVSGRPLRVDAIGELDLYKREPWDLPALSRLRSGDMEWYFFSPLDRKYATRSRTNRATEKGYWKTTGKDRPVVHAGSTVGMKKTLVFHSGRAPRGQRTNWVMHEYRLDGADHLPQDAYVVCRIFQKNGAGPQNGAQYGAPFVEEEWEVEEGEEQTTVPQDGNLGLPDGGDEEYFQATDFMENLDVGNQQENTSIFTMVGTEQIGDSQLEEPAIALEDLLNDQNLEVDGDGFIVMPERQDTMPINDMEETAGVDKTHCSPTQSDGYLELNDIANAENVDGLSENNIVGCPLDACTDLVYGADESIIPPDMHDCEEFFDILNENFEDSELFQNPLDAQDDLCMQPNNPPNPMSGDDLPVLPTEDNLAFDAPSHEFRGDNFTEMNDIFSPMPNSSGYDMMDELMAFFDATDANLHYAPLDSLHKPECLDSSQQVNGGSISTSEAFEQGLGEGAEMGSSSSTGLTPSDNKPSEKNNNMLDEPRNEGWDHSLTKHLVNMLGSISSPPALAAEIPEKAVKMCAQNSAAHSASSIHLTAGMIHIRGSTLISKEEHWFVQKHDSVRFHLSYGMAGNSTAGKLLPFDPATKVQSGVLTVVLRDWFYAFFLSALFLAASFRIGVCIYSR